ncbi:hypothetical protein D043_4241A, partial [Vibrio parahaemolyticus EKP-021]
MFCSFASDAGLLNTTERSHFSRDHAFVNADHAVFER